jgi:hypothetical protein
MTFQPLTKEIIIRQLPGKCKNQSCVGVLEEQIAGDELVPDTFKETHGITPPENSLKIKEFLYILPFSSGKQVHRPPISIASSLTVSAGRHRMPHLKSEFMNTEFRRKFFPWIDCGVSPDTCILTHNWIYP